MKPRADLSHAWFCLNLHPHHQIHLFRALGQRMNGCSQSICLPPSLPTPGSGLECMCVDVPVSSLEQIHTWNNFILGISQAWGCPYWQFSPSLGGKTKGPCGQGILRLQVPRMWSRMGGEGMSPRSALLLEPWTLLCGEGYSHSKARVRASKVQDPRQVS